MAKQHKAGGRHTEAAHKIDIEELLSKFPATGNDRFWSSEPFARKGFNAAHRVFDKHFKSKLKVKEKGKPAN